MNQLKSLGIHDSWHNDFDPIFKSKDMAKVINTYKSSTIPVYPDIYRVFKAFQLPKDQVRLVVLGQDPYPDGRATGLAFAVGREQKVPLSLQIIKREIFKDYGITEAPFDNTLTHWINQGILLLNSSLTVPHGKPGEHSNLWRPIIHSMIALISFELDPTWLLIGGEAAKFESAIKYSEKHNYKIVKRSHPAAERYGHAFNGFVDEINNYVKIHWI